MIIDTALPLVVTALLALGLPALLTPAMTLSQSDVMRGIGLSALLILILGWLLFAGLYALSGKPVATAIEAAPLWSVLFFLKRSAALALLWAPLLGLVWLIRAQGVEERRGLAMSERDRS